MYLVWEIFLEFEAPDYVEEGINNLEMYGAYEREILAA